MQPRYRFEGPGRWQSARAASSVCAASTVLPTCGDQALDEFHIGYDVIVLGLKRVARGGLSMALSRGVLALFIQQQGEIGFDVGDLVAASRAAK